jgi:glutamine amidotransferase
MNIPIAVVDYGHGNLGSILNMLKKLGSAGVLVSDPGHLDRAQKIILPGVGAFDSGMRALEEKGFRDVLIRKAIVDKVPLLGICLGMQMLGQNSEEGIANGLGLISGRCRRFTQSADMRLKVPHMGWTEVLPSTTALLFKGIDMPPRFYFVHSYYFECDDQSDVAASAIYGVSYSAAVQRGNIFGVQFHPEKSHRFGMHLLRNFVGL